MSTKRIISDQVLYKLAGGVPDTAFPVQEFDIWKALEQKINSYFKLKHFDTTLPSGETIPENTMIATYEDIAVTANENGTSQSTLPVIPISLPKSVGIFLIYDPNFPDTPFIPLQRGQKALVKTDEVLGDLMGLIAYEPKNNVIIYNQDITLFDITTVTMELCVFDMSQYGVSDRLPIPADFEERLIQELVMEFSPIVAESGVVNPWTTANSNPPSNFSK